jgi:hypothetical protein
MAKRMTIQIALEEFELYDLYADIIESYGQELEDPSLVSDLYDLIDEDEEKYEFRPDSDGDFSESFERNLREAITIIVEANEELIFLHDDYLDDDEPGIFGDGFDADSKAFSDDAFDEDQGEF